MSIAAPFGRKSRLRASDLPLLRSMRDAYRRMLAAAEALRTDPEFITDAAMRITTDAVQLLGGYGYCNDYRVERLMRDAKITQIWEGTNQVHRQLIGRSFLKK